MLGAQVMPHGAPSAMLSDRISAAAELYKAGRVDKLLLSGDHRRVKYDEVGTMRRILLAQGIPPAGHLHRPRRLRHVGLRAARPPCLRRQRPPWWSPSSFHMARALYDARRAGLDATGFAADRRDYGRVQRRLKIREAAARVKTLGDVVTGADPHFLGTPHPDHRRRAPARGAPLDIV